MKIEEFIRVYKGKNEKDREALLKKHIVREYVPFEEKVALCEKIRNRSMYKEVNGTSVFSINSPIMYELLVCVVFSNYTDLVIGQDEEMLQSFNLIEQYDLYSVLNKLIQDIDRFKTVLYMVRDDAAENNSLVAFLDSKMESLNILFNELSKTAE